MAQIVKKISGSKNLKFENQNLTDTEKATARQNIDVNKINVGEISLKIDTNGITYNGETISWLNKVGGGWYCQITTPYTRKINALFKMWNNSDFSKYVLVPYFVNSCLEIFTLTKPESTINCEIQIIYLS